MQFPHNALYCQSSPAHADSAGTSARAQSGAYPRQRLGAIPVAGGKTDFLLWAPHALKVDLHIVAPRERILPMDAGALGYFSVTAEQCGPGARYLYRVNGSVDRPDPASKRQPRGVHGPSEVVAPHIVEAGNWTGIPLDAYVIYELHVGTFTADGTLDAIIPHLKRLKALGITAIELMPLAEFPGSRNWGYDGVNVFAVAGCYGGVEALRRLVEASHRIGIAVVLDVVYNHFGPEGNYLREFGPYFTGRHHTPWGDAMNLDGPESAEVRRFFIENALYWVNDLCIDALRLDAVHAMIDDSAVPLLQELAAAVNRVGAERGRLIHVIAESDLNDSRIVRPVEEGGFGLSAQWSDDLHHSVHALLTGESGGYYQDFGGLGQLAAALENGWTYTGQHSRFRGRNFGTSPAGVQAHQFVVCSQNHDQIGNRMNGERLLALTDWDRARLAAATVLLSPYVPLMFMGEEYGETSPFLYFIDHTDAALRQAVREGRKREFEFLHAGEPPDPGAVETFHASKLNHHLRKTGKHAQMYAFYTELLTLRRDFSAFWRQGKANLQVELFEDAESILVRRTGTGQHLLFLFHYGDGVASVPCILPTGSWTLILNSAASERWGGADAADPWTCETNGDVVNISLDRYSCLVLSGILL